MVKRPFYTHPDPDDPRWSRSFDLLFRGLELVTGGQRLHRYSDYVAALEARGEPLEPYAAYVDTFRYGIPPHGGFAIGLERWTGAAARGREHPRGDAVPARPAPAGPVAGRLARRGLVPASRPPTAPVKPALPGVIAPGQCGFRRCTCETGSGSAPVAAARARRYE